MSAPRAFTTGASSGIGYALTRALAQSGYEVWATARREAPLAGLVETLTRDGHRAHYEVLDVNDTEPFVARLRALDATHAFDLVIANAGVGKPEHVRDATSWEALAPAFHTNFCGAAATLTALTGAMVARGSGHLVGIGSFASFGALPQSAAYCAPKAGLSMLLACLQMDLAGTGVAVTDVRLGFVRTPMVANSTHPMPQLLDADDAAARVVKGLRKRPRTLTIPEPLGFAARAGSLLPNAVREALLRFYAPVNAKG
jgi:short-subunit dehydrogenase